MRLCPIRGCNRGDRDLDIGRGAWVCLLSFRGSFLESFCLSFCQEHRHNLVILRFWSNICFFLFLLIVVLRDLLILLFIRCLDRFVLHSRSWIDLLNRDPMELRFVEVKDQINLFRLLFLEHFCCLERSDRGEDEWVYNIFHIRDMNLLSLSFSCGFGSLKLYLYVPHINE